MKLQTVLQSPFPKLRTGYDVIVCASGYESRARFVVCDLASKSIQGANKYAFAFKEHDKVHTRLENDTEIIRLGYELLPCSGQSATDAREGFEKALSTLPEGKPARILIDISSMTRAWYGEIVHTLLTMTRDSVVQVDFVYTSAEFIEPPTDYPANRVAVPVPGFFGMALPDKPTALGIGLGYHRDRALGLKDYLDPKLTVLFCPNPSLRPQYVESVKAANEQIMSEVSENNIVPYPVSDWVGTFRILDSFCEGLMRGSRLVLCSFGPKTFGLCCFLAAARRRDISIWRVSADEHETPVDHKPDGVPLVLETTWV